MPAVKKLSAITRNALLEDLARDKPSPTKWDTWCEKKAEQYQCEVEQVSKFLSQKLEYMEVQANIASMPHAQKIAAFLGATRTKAIQTLLDGMDAMKTRLVRVENPGEGDPRTVEVTEPDWDIRRGCSGDILKVWGAYAPQEITVRHGLTEELAALSDEDLKKRVAEKNEALQKLLVAATPPSQVQ